jgi:hypothetical protein
MLRSLAQLTLAVIAKSVQTATAPMKAPMSGRFSSRVISPTCASRSSAGAAGVGGVGVVTVIVSIRAAPSARG